MLTSGRKEEQPDKPVKGLSAAKVEIPRKPKPASQPASKPDATPSNGTHKVDDQRIGSKLKRSLEDDETEPGDAKKRKLKDSKSSEADVLILDDGGEGGDGAIVID